MLATVTIRQMASQQSRSTIGWIALVTALTPALALTVLLSLFIVGGSVALRGPSVVQHSWPIVYGIQAVLAAAALFVVARYGAGWLSARALLALVAAVWVSELLVVLLIHPILANELTPVSTVVYWLMATGGPLQPAAALVGGILAITHRQRRTNPSPRGSRGSTTKVE